jgi:L-threonylcarbamoyladenylate synthase
LANIQTLKLAVDGNALDSPEPDKALRQAAEILRRGGTVAFPTETVYGLGANALDVAAVGRIFEAKRRPSWDPLIVHVADAEQLERVVDVVPAKARLLMDAFWPGPLTLLLPRSGALPGIVTAGRRLVGVRMPQHPIARRLIELAGLPIAAPSANSFGRTSPTRAQFVLEDLDGRIDAVIDGGKTTLGLESTVVDVCEEPPVLYRPGIVTFEQIRSVLGTLVRYHAPEGKAPAPEAQPSPGVGLQHYAPLARLILFDLAEIDQASKLARKLQGEGATVGIMLPDEYRSTTLSELSLVYRWGKWSDKGELARRLFAGLRELDALGVSVILCPLPDEEGIGAAIRDRLLKAAKSSS